MKRQVKEEQGTALYQVIYKGQNDTLFFFYQDTDENDQSKLTMKLGLMHIEKDMSKTKAFFVDKG